MRSFLLHIALLLTLSAGTALAAIESHDFADPSQRARYQQLTEELRCPKCQNQNLADSDSQIAADLRHELYAQLVAGKSDEEIIAFMRERYGDFVLYKPKFQRNTWLLWLGPLALMAGVAIWLFLTRRNTGTTTTEIPEKDSSQHSTPTPVTAGSRWVNVVSLLALMAVATGSWILYRQLGAQPQLEMTALGNSVFSGQLSDAEMATKQAALLSSLDSWLVQHPDDEKFLYMRARLLSETQSWEAAARDYRALLSRFPDQDNLLAEYAQILFLQANRTLTPDVTAFLKQALQANPHNATALGLLGMYAFEQQDYASAVGFWERLLRVVPAGSAEAEAITSGVQRARELGNIPAATSSDIHLAVQVSVAAEATAKPEDIVFVLLRAKDGPRMPLAVVRTTVAALTQPVELDTAQSPMRGQIDLDAVDTFEVVARLSRSGQPVAAPGDWEGSSQPMVRHQIPATLTVVIGQPVAP